MINFNYGVEYSFNTYAPFILGSKYEELTYAGTVNYFVANKLGVNCYLTHRQIYHLLPKSTPDNPTLYTYHLFITNNKGVKVFGDPWINKASIQEGKKLNVILTIPNVLNDDLAIIRDRLKSIGFGNNSYTVNKVKSMNGASNSIFEILTGQVPVGGGIEENPLPTEEEIGQEGTSQIYQPYLLTDLTELNPYLKIKLSPFIDALSVGVSHAGTEYQIAADREFEELVFEDTEETNLTIISDPKVLSDGSTYYLRFRYLASNNLTSKWSEIYPFVYKEFYTAPSGRKYKRHENNQGSVMKWVDKEGQTHETFIFDAIYRNIYTFIKLDSETSTLEEYQGKNIISNVAMTDEELNSLPNYFEDKSTSNANTSAYFTTDKRTNTACGFSYNQQVSIDNVNVSGCIPNIQIALRIMSDKRVIDELDPTIVNSKHNLYLATKAIWSSTKNTFTDERLSVWTVDNNVVASPQLVEKEITVVPVYELS